jgi:NAD(P)H-dependent nitrite reductase small subunit
MTESDAKHDEERQYHKVASINEIPMGSGRMIEVADRQIALFNFDGRFYAISDMCPHRGASLAEGFVDGGKVFCPWHCFDFSLQTGESATVPSLRVQTFDVKVEGEDVLVAC